ncbi:MAG: hypothetical protein VX515_02065 [Candidatus Thermoplasmatota archaeon]|nr:hypothetical protein [Candidatus Thermoplasmatota archaeon]|tara:strand:- start:1360 stop:2247 length:888 start_codon:yes stop_codon:yes gene_type:complete
MKRLLVVFKKNHEEVHDSALRTVISVLEERLQAGEIQYRTVARESVSREDFIGPDVVIVLGGDGTLTSIAHSVDDKSLVMGVNSHPMEGDGEGSFGFYMGSNATNFSSDLRRVLDETCIVNVLPRLQAEIVTTSGNILRSDPALNDLLVANTHQYQPSKYRLERASDKHNPGLDLRQSSSGMLFSTFLGQGAWFRHAVDIQESKFPKDELDDHYLALSRDLPHLSRGGDGSHWAWTNEATVLTSDMHRGYVVADGWDEIHFTRGAKITVSNNGPKLNLATFDDGIYARVSKWIRE